MKIHKIETIRIPEHPNAHRHRRPLALGPELCPADRPVLEPYDVFWMEDIIQPDSVADLVRLVDETAACRRR